MRGVCQGCLQERNVKRNRMSKKLLCEGCFRKDTSKHEKCSVCGKMRSVKVRTEDRKPVCTSCYEHSRYYGHGLATANRVCVRCQKFRRVGMRTEKGPVCVLCRRKEMRARHAIVHAQLRLNTLLGVS